MGKHGARAISLLLLFLLLPGCAGVPARAAAPAARPQGPVYARLFVPLTPGPVPVPPIPTPSPPPIPPAPTPSAQPYASPSASASPAPSLSASPAAVTLTDAQLAALSPTIRMPFAELVGDNGEYDPPAAYPAPDTYRVVIDVYHQVVLVYGRDGSGQYTVPVRFMVCTTGKQKTPTPIGTFRSAGRRVRFGFFADYDVYGQYWTQINRGIYFHSLLYTERDANYYTNSSYRNLGKRESHGCVRLLVPDARWIYYHIAPGTQIEIRGGSKSDLLTAAIKAKLTRAKVPSKRPDLDPATLPSTDNWSTATYLAGYTRTVPAK